MLDKTPKRDGRTTDGQTDRYHLSITAVCFFEQSRRAVKTTAVPRHDILEIRSSSSVSHGAARYEGTSAHWIIVKRRMAPRRSAPVRLGLDRTGQLAWWTDLPMRYDDVVTDVLPHSQPSPSSAASSSLSLTRSLWSSPTYFQRGKLVFRACSFTRHKLAQCVGEYSSSLCDANYHVSPRFHQFNLQC